MTTVRDSSREKYTTENFIIYKVVNGKGHLVISVSKKIAKKAVDRNRIKRTIIESIKGLNYKGQLKVIIKNNVANKKMQEVKKEMEIITK